MAIAAYVYYTQQYADTYLDFSSLLRETKEDILTKALKNEVSRAQQLTEGLSDEDRAKMEDYLSGSWVDDFNKEIGDANSAAQVVFPETYEAAIALLDNATEAALESGEFAKALNQLLIAADKEYQFNLDAYAMDVIQFFAKSNTGATRNKSWATNNSSQLAQKIVNNLLGSYSGSGFDLKRKNVNYNSDRINHSFAKLAMLATQLPWLTYAKKGERVTDYYLASKGTKAQKHAFWEDAMEKIKKWVSNFMSLMAEVAVAEGYLSSESKIRKAIADLHKGIRITGSNKGVRLTLTEDPLLQKDITQLVEYRENNGFGKNAGAVWNSLQQMATSKMDVGEDYVVGTIGFSVKDYQTNDLSLSGLTSSYEFHTQSSTPLLTYLLRECGYTMEDVRLAVNLGAALPYNMGLKADNQWEGSFASNWDTFIELIKYKGLLATLAGLDHSEDQTHFMVLNGKIFTVADLLALMVAQFREKRNAVSSANLISEKGDGLERSKYEEINDRHFLPPTIGGGKTWQLAHSRSETAYPEILNLMYNTKIETSITIREIGLLLGR